VLLLHEVTKEREQQAYLSTQERLATVGQLAAGIAHDFNNIMSVIVLYSQALQQSEMAVRDRERLVAIYHQARRAASLISQILDFSRRAIVARHEFNLLPFLKELVQLFERTLPETITIELQAGRDPYVVNADPTRLQQALMNLAVNARDAMPRGGKLLIRLQRHERSWEPPLPDMHARAWLHLTVADTGCGIAAHHLAHIFEPFFTTKAPGQGTGLGLAQVYGIVKQHDGYIDVESAEGAGTTFHIFLPAASSPPLEMPAEPARLHLAHGETLLVVEDDPTTLQALQETLRTWGYHVLTATNGEEALEQYRTHEDEIALVLSDMVMPRLNGTGLLQELRHRNPAAKIILFTGYPLDEKGRSLISDSGAVWVQKPFTGEKIASVVQRMLEGETP
jgi:nitrogen-specific signal transduction histidine kinase/CheY-like chemotaxis protein